MTPPPLGLYVHFPWCVRKCPYCDFNSHPLRGELREDEYREALLRDLAMERERFGPRRIDTVYFGGGTPSLFAAPTFRALIDAAPDAVEVTMEANPGTTEHGDFHAVRAAGVTRISLGAQSFDASQLARLGRIHGADETRRAARTVAEAGFESFNIDLMYGLPGQSVEAAMDDLREAIRLDPPHISWYQLTLEPKTEFARRPPQGLPDSDQAADIEAAGIDLLARHGYERYEVSAFARAGHRSAHNINYWRFGDYIGIGAGAHGKLTCGDEVVRTTKPSQPRRYLAGEEGSEIVVPKAELPLEFMMNVLRLVDGVENELFEVRTGLALGEIAPTLEPLVKWGLMHPGRLALTASGYPQLDAVLKRFAAYA